ncbi:hypothetical protein Syun_026669 [Stephania yunnanensis]|uniref:Uncharacterized protein n=1 Tax=Stephania yunnanensis TaxID=152371 RepID=A0AAP0F2W8_9MAGN
MEVEVQTALDPLKPSAFRLMSHDHRPNHKMISKQVLGSIELKVIYLRVITSSSYPNTMQNCISLRFPPRDSQFCSCLEINGFKISPRERATRALNRHREDAFMSESIYVNTDTIRFRGSCLPFEVRLQGSVVVLSGTLRVKENGICGGIDNSKEDCKKWIMECKRGGGADEQISGSNILLVDAYFAGRSAGKPVLLNCFAELNKKTDWRGLDCIHEGEEIKDFHSKQEQEEKLVKEFDKHKITDAQESNADEEEMYAEEEGQLSWFNEGVRVGIGLGVGLSIGVGVSLGLLRRTLTVFKKVL